jgi:hypothetical protein
MLTINNDGDINMSGLNGVLDLKQTRILQVLDARSGSHGVSRVLEPDPVNLSNYFYDRSKLSSQETKEVELYLAAKPLVRTAYEQTISNENTRKSRVRTFALGNI